MVLDRGRARSMMRKEQRHTDRIPVRLLEAKVGPCIPYTFVIECRAHLCGPGGMLPAGDEAA